MKPWQDELLETAWKITKKDELIHIINGEARQLGFDYWAYGLRLPLNLTNPRIVMHNNYPSGWQACYARERYMEIDPTVRHCSRSTLPVIWTQDVIDDAPGFWEDARSYGLCIGWSQSSLDPAGVRGMLTLARNAKSLSKAELQANGIRMAWLTQVVHLCMSRIAKEQFLPESQIVLTHRERAVLQWTAEGKTSGEIADILSITERTVNFHITNSMAKLNCANKTAATVRAALLGLLS